MVELKSKNAQSVRDQILRAVQQSETPLTRAEIVAATGLTYNQLRRQLPQLIQARKIGWSSQRNDRGHEIRQYWVIVLLLLVTGVPAIGNGTEFPARPQSATIKQA